jgi:hypothetical protein
MSAPELQDGLQRADSVAKLLANLCAAIDGLEGCERHEDLVALARSNLFHPASLLLDGVPGAIHREAWLALKHDAHADTPGRRWEQAGHSRGRESIKRFLAAEDWPVYATIPFRTIETDKGPRIGAAVGGERLLAGKRHDPANPGLKLWEPYKSMTAVKRGNLLTVDGELLTRPGPRVVDGAARLCEALEAMRQRRPK